MSIIESNKLIAEFMGGKYVPDNEHVFSHFIIDGVVRPPSYVRYNSSWDWLMIVVERINDLNNVVEIHENHVRVVNNERSEVLVDVVAGSMFEAIYQSVVEFIVWHKQKEK